MAPEDRSYILYRPEDEPEAGDSEDWKSQEADDFDDGAADGEFNGEIEIDFDEFLTRKH